MSVAIRCRCIMGHKFVLSAAGHEAAQDLGCVICPKCSNPAIVCRIDIREAPTPDAQGETK